MTEIKLSDCIQRIEIGNGVAEHDDLLFNCLLETPHFSYLLHDKADLILGSKGSGKSSLYRTFGEYLSSTLFEKWKTIAVSGVETMGDPIFKSYSPNFANFSEDQFENFWKAYLLSLVYNKIVHDDKVSTVFSGCLSEFDEFKKQYAQLGLVDVGKISSPTKLLQVICSCTVAAIEGIKAAWDYEKNQLVFGANIREKVTHEYQQILIPNISRLDSVLAIDALSILAKKAGYKVWVLLDHLDVVFPRRSLVEKKALRALLKVLYAFTLEEVRLKIFLRDDVLDSISMDENEPLAALSHITARATPPLKWNSDDLCLMIMKRLAHNYWLANKYSIDMDKLQSSEYARECFHKIFTRKYKSQLAFDWILSLVTDGREVVTPRDLIDLLKNAFHIHSDWLSKHPESLEMMSIQAIQEAHLQLSRNRKETVLQTEYSHFYQWIRKLERNKDKYRREELESVFGEEANQAIAALQGIGILHFGHKGAYYKVAQLYIPGLQVFRTRSKRKKKIPEAPTQNQGLIG